MRIEFWGTRGSIPSPGPNTIKYGGNTPCLTVTLKDDSLLIFDAGTGIRQLGLSLEEKREPIKVNIFITHSHWDHIQGVPFFTPAYHPQNELTIMGCASVNQHIRKSLTDLMQQPYFPVGFETLKASINFLDHFSGRFDVKQAQIEVIPLNHPGDGLGFKVIEDDCVFVFLTDNELNAPQMNTSYEQLVDFCSGADLLVHDAMYTKEEQEARQGWGHSYYGDALQLAIDSQVKQLALFHHEPEHNDAAIDAIVEDCHKIIQTNSSDLICFGARERQTVEISATA